MASLPPLPRFDRADRLPINRDRLQQRLRILTTEDRELVDRIGAVIRWQRQTAASTDAEVVAAYHRVVQAIGDTELMAIFEFPVNQRTVMIALRRRHRVLSAPESGQPWGVGRWVHHIERNWDDPDLKLAAVYPWIPRARAHLEGEETLALDRLLMGEVWDRMDRIAERDVFSFEALLAYLFKWDILDQWLSYDREAAQARFERRDSRSSARQRLSGSKRAWSPSTWVSHRFAKTRSATSSWVKSASWPRCSACTAARPTCRSSKIPGAFGSATRWN
jgi:hypothetical protein